MPLIDSLQAPESGERVWWRDPARTLWSEIRIQRALARQAQVIPGRAFPSRGRTIPMIEQACVGSTKAGKADA